MIETGIYEMMHKETSNVVKKLLETVPDVVIENKLEDRMAEVGLNQKQISLLTGLRHGSISEYVNGKKINISKYQLVALMIGLRVTDIKDIIDIRFPEETVEKFKEERETWQTNGTIPEELQLHYISALED